MFYASKRPEKEPMHILKSNAFNKNTHAHIDRESCLLERYSSDVATDAAELQTILFARKVCKMRSAGMHIVERALRLERRVGTTRVSTEISITPRTEHKQTLTHSHDNYCSERVV